MQRIESRLTVSFDEPFWIGLYERIEDGRLEVCKIIFGPEPKDYEVYECLLQSWNTLKFSPPIEADAKPSMKINPKRMQRAIKKQLKEQGISTKSQRALKLQQEAGKASRHEKIRQKKEEEKHFQFELRQQKKKQKHKGH